MLQSLYLSVTLIMALVSSTDATSFRPSSRPEMLQRRGTERRTNTLSAAATIQASATFLVCQIGQEAALAVVAINGVEAAVMECIDPVSTSLITPPILSVIPIVPSSSSTSVPVSSSTSTVSLPTTTPVTTSSISSSIISKSTSIKTSSTTTTSASPSSATTLSSEQAIALKAHNVARAAHHVDPLVWDDNLEEAAARWSNGCRFAHSRGMLFPSSYTYGENIYSSSPIVRMSSVVYAFMSEESSYDYAAGEFSNQTGQFTQVVWKDTKKVGCAITTCQLEGVFGAGSTQATLAVCLYFPSGNYFEEYTDNVFPA